MSAPMDVNSTPAVLEKLNMPLDQIIKEAKKDKVKQQQSNRRRNQVNKRRNLPESTVENKTTQQFPSSASRQPPRNRNPRRRRPTAPRGGQSNNSSNTTTTTTTTTHNKNNNNHSSEIKISISGKGNNNDLTNASPFPLPPTIERSFKSENSRPAPRRQSIKVSTTGRSSRSGGRSQPRVIPKRDISNSNRNNNNHNNHNNHNNSAPAPAREVKKETTTKTTGLTLNERFTSFKKK